MSSFCAEVFRSQFHQHFMHAFFVLKRIEHLFSNYSRLCNFLAPKKSHIKCWWNWHLDPGFLVHSGAKIIHRPVQLCNNYNVNYVWNYISAQMMGKQSSIFFAMCQICYIKFFRSLNLQNCITVVKKTSVKARYLSWSFQASNANKLLEMQSKLAKQQYLAKISFEPVLSIRLLTIRKLNKEFF